MTKSTITRERLAKIKSWRETYGAGSNVMLPVEEAEELARMALAAMESRTVKLPKLKMLEDYLAEVAIEERKQILVGVKLEFHRALAAAGIKVEAE